MFRLRNTVTLAIFVIFAGVLAACAPTEKDDCDGAYDPVKEQREYEDCLAEVALHQENQTATSVARRVATATFEAEIAIERADYAATVAALDAEPVKSGDRQTLSRAGTIAGSVTKDDNAIPTAIAVPTPDPTTVPVMPTAVPTPVPTPVPTATEISVDLSTLTWLTAKQAAELAMAESPGVVFEIAGHASRAAGSLASGDTSGSDPSPGIGYARDWSVTLQTDTETYFCTIGLGLTSCNSSNFHYGDGEVETVTQDSPDALERFNGESNSDWQDLMANENISILLDLHVDLTGAVNAEPGTPIARIWSATITVHNATEGPSSGNFHWNLDTDDVTWSVF